MAVTTDYTKSLMSPNEVIIASSGVAITRTSTNTAADTTQQNLVSVPMAGGSIGKNGWVEVDVTWRVTNSATAKNLRIKLGTTDFRLQALTTNTSVRDNVYIRNRNSFTSQVGSSSMTLANPYNNSTSVPPTGTVDTSVDFTVNIACDFGAAVAANDIIIEQYTIRAVKRD